MSHKLTLPEGARRGSILKVTYQVNGKAQDWYGLLVGGFGPFVHVKLWGIEGDDYGYNSIYLAKGYDADTKESVTRIERITVKQLYGTWTKSEEFQKIMKRRAK